MSERREDYRLHTIAEFDPIEPAVRPAHRAGDAGRGAARSPVSSCPEAGRSRRHDLRSSSGWPCLAAVLCSCSAGPASSPPTPPSAARSGRAPVRARPRRRARGTRFARISAGLQPDPDRSVAGARADPGRLPLPADRRCSSSARGHRHPALRAGPAARAGVRGRRAGRRLPAAPRLAAAGPGASPREVRPADPRAGPDPVQRDQRRAVASPPPGRWPRPRWPSRPGRRSSG